MSNEDLVKALFAFLLGLLAKILYDFWNERRKRKGLAFTKTIIGSFTKDSLEEQLQDYTQVYYSGLDVQSIHLVRVKLKNVGYAAIKHQVFSVKFTENAQIIGRPALSGSDEDLKLITEDHSQKANQQRFVVDVIQKGREIAVDFVVINHGTSEFEVQHGIDPEMATSMDPTDLDVDVSLSGEQLGVNFVSLLKQWVIVALLLPIMYVIRNLLNDLGGTVGSVTFASLWNIFIIGAWIGLMHISYRLVPLLIEWLETFIFGPGTLTRIAGDYISGDKVGADKVSSDKISIGDILRATGVAIGTGASVETAQLTQLQGQIDAIDQLFMDLTAQLEGTLLSEAEKLAAGQILIELEKEASKGEKASEEVIFNWLNTLGAISLDLQSEAVSLFQSPVDELSEAFRVVAENPKFRKELPSTID